ncbi:MAG: glycosyltransferase family 2 protein [Bryobacteraceae bacterium]
MLPDYIPGSSPGSIREIDLASLPIPSDYSPITVAVCTRDRHLALRRCLESIAKLHYPNYEVLVVDNASKSDATRELTLQYGFRYVREDRPGLDWARNCALQQASHEVVAFTDDDVRVDRLWLQGVARGFAFGDAACVTGLICPLEMSWPAQMLFEQYGGMGKGSSQSYSTPHACLWLG